MSPRILALLLTLYSAAIASETSPLFPLRTPEPFPDAAATFEEARRLIRDNYYSDRLDEDALWWAAVRGMLRHVSPPEDPERATLWPPSAYQQVADSLKGVTHASGLQSRYNPADASLTVTAVERGSPADGLLKPWDRILRIDGRRLAGMQAADIESLLRGEEGQHRRLAVVRDLEVLDVDLVFHAYRIPLVDAQMLPGEVLYARLRSISLGASEALAGALRAQPVRDGGARRLVLDLRDNGGGVFVEGLRVAELFLKRNDIVVRSVRRREGLQNYVSGNDAPIPVRAVVLVNAGTASAAEMLAAALDAHGLATLVGRSTFGKATMEETFTLGNGYRIKFIVGALYDPRGTSWHARGLTPDIVTETAAPLPAEVPAAERLRRDSALAAAWHLLADAPVTP